MADAHEQAMAECEADAKCLAFLLDGGVTKAFGTRRESADASPGARAMPEIVERAVRAIVRQQEIHDGFRSGMAKQLAALDRTVSAQGQRIGELEAKARDRAEVPASKPAPCTCGSPDLPGTHRWYGQPCFREPEDGFLTPPPIARAIGRAVMAAAARFPASNPTNARHFQTIAKASAEVKTEAAATLGARLVNILDRLGRGEPIQAHYALVEAIGDAKRAGVIP
jgi:hypothetical protein